jgi:hypothetical protein
VAPNTTGAAAVLPNANGRPPPGVLAPPPNDTVVDFAGAPVSKVQSHKSYP